MISPRRLTQIARRWLRAAAAGRKRITFPRVNVDAAAEQLGRDACRATSGPAPRKGHFVAYSSDGQRFEVPLPFLKSEIFGELLKMSEDVYGLPGDGPITLPCDAAVLGNVLSWLRSPGRAIFTSMAVARRRSASSSLAPCPFTLNQMHSHQFVACAC